MSTTDLLIRSGVAAGVASLALGLYLLRLLRRQKRQMAQLLLQIKQHTEENNALLQRMRNTVQPQFVPVGITLDETINRIDIKVQNKGATAVVEKVVTSTPDIEFLDDRFFPLRIEANDMFVVTGLSKGLPLPHCRYVVQLHYSDAHGNHYLTAIRGEGQEYRVTTSLKS